MKIVMTLLVRDSADILAENLTFHLDRGVDFFVLMDNRSQDRTAAIARAFQRDGVLQYLYQEEDTYSQSAWVTEMARMAHTDHGADWVINSDDDEFWYPRDGSLKSTLAHIPADVFALRAHRTNFVARHDDHRPFWQRMTVRTLDSRNALGAPLQPKVLHRGAADVIVAAGNHSARTGDASPAVEDAAIDILHFPVRSYRQYMNKIVKGGQAYARNTELDPGIGETWRHVYRRYLEGAFDEEYQRELCSDVDAERGIARGELVRDLRLLEALSR